VVTRLGGKSEVIQYDKYWMRVRFWRCLLYQHLVRRVVKRAIESCEVMGGRRNILIPTECLAPLLERNRGVLEPC